MKDVEDLFDVKPRSQMLRDVETDGGTRERRREFKIAIYQIPLQTPSPRPSPRPPPPVKKSKPSLRKSPNLIKKPSENDGRKKSEWVRRDEKRNEN